MKIAICDDISTHALHAESDRQQLSYDLSVFNHFYPRSPCGERHATVGVASGVLDFYPRSPCGERQKYGVNAVTLNPFLPTLSMRRATYRSHDPGQQNVISTHALHAESDAPKRPLTIDDLNFYPRSPCGERHGRAARHERTTQDFYPRSPCGERHSVTLLSERTAADFYPRSPCGERPGRRNPGAGRFVFLPTLSMRRATTKAKILPALPKDFYPRSPCGERPIDERILSCLNNNFYPRSPCGERPLLNFIPYITTKFLPTLSMRRATAKDNKNTYKIYSQFVKTQNHCGLCPLILPHTAFK